ncbi:MAG TPA: peptide-methionine (S)-S-oxide reductase MsrA [Chthoniobacterales bacterium]|nr:peptide-methionine (S)-S-oxide reductase MsrA [Chthoniobacterales bacterium]
MRRAILTCALAILGVVDGAWGQGTAPANEAKAVFAGGCFWCMQPPFDHVPGVTATLVGYAGGREENPTYKQVSAGETSHRESIEVTYDPAKVSYDKLLEVFWHNINPIQTDGQFHDIGDQYTTAIFYTNEEQKTAAEASKDALAKSGKFPKPIATAILPATKFWPAEEYHQKYYIKNPSAYGIYHFVSGRDSYKQRTWGSER